MLLLGRSSKRWKHRASSRRRRHHPRSHLDWVATVQPANDYSNLLGSCEAAMPEEAFRYEARHATWYGYRTSADREEFSHAQQGCTLQLSTHRSCIVCLCDTTDPHTALPWRMCISGNTKAMSSASSRDDYYSIGTRWRIGALGEVFHRPDRHGSATAERDADISTYNEMAWHPD